MSTENQTAKTAKRDRIGVILYLLYVVLLLASAVLILRIIGIQLFFNPDPKIEAALTRFREEGAHAVVTLHLAYSPSLEAADALEFERAAYLRDQIKSLEKKMV